MRCISSQALPLYLLFTCNNMFSQAETRICESLVSAILISLGREQSTLYICTNIVRGQWPSLDNLTTLVNHHVTTLVDWSVTAQDLQNCYNFTYYKFTHC